ncbi:PAS domain S-box protein [Haloferax sp. DFSO60]|uniref:PAS domain-containing protein n=1 Tax=Haloferax sp. DFSO60 TaxID=3388652 RepID=UPI00397DB912
MEEWSRKIGGTDHSTNILQQLFQSVEKYAIILLDPDGTIATWNEGAERMLGYSESEVLGNHVTMFYPDEQSKAETTDALAYATAHGSSECIGWCNRKDGSKLWAEVTISSLVGENGTTSGFAKVVRDNTETRAYQQQLKRSRDRLERTEAMADIGGWEVDIGTNQLRLTEGTLELLAVSPSAVSKQADFFELFHPDDRETLEDAITRASETGEAFDLELRVATTNNANQWVQVRGDFIDDGTLLRGAIRDVSARKEREQRLMVLNRVLRHNLRNNLNVVTGYAESLKSDIEALALPDAVEGDGNEISEIVNNLSAVTHDIDTELTAIRKTIDAVGEFSSEEAIHKTTRIVEHSEELLSTGEKARKFEQAVKSKDQSSATQLHSVFTELKHRYSSKFPEATITVDDTKAIVSGNVESIRLAVGELVNNALEHNDHETPTVSLSTSRESEGSVCLHVSDNGPGIPDIERKILQQGEETALLHGEGMGLWTVNWIVTQLGGEVTINDNDPRGTVVILTLSSATQPE